MQPQNNQNLQRNPKYSWVFHELTKNDGDDHNLVSYIAYSLYKERKVQFFESKGGIPSDEEVQVFNAAYLMPSQLDGLRNEAESILADILKELFTEKVQEVETKLQNSFSAEMIRKFEALATKVEANHTLLNNEVKSNFSSLDTLVNNSKTSIESDFKSKFGTLDLKVGTNHSDIHKEITKFNERGWKYWLTEVIKGALIAVVATLIVWNFSYALLGKAKLSEHEGKTLPQTIEPKS